MIFEGIQFNEEHWKTKTEAEFIAGEKHHDLSEERMKEVYSLINPPVFSSRDDREDKKPKAKKVFDPIGDTSIE